MMGNLLKIFANNTRSLEVLCLLNGIKKVVRLDADEIELEKIKEFCSKEGLHLEISDFKAIKILDEGKGQYSNLMRKAPINSPGQGIVHVYISRDKNKANFLKLLENKNDDKAVGELLGYPECCVDFFINNREKQQKLQNDYILPALENSNGYEFPFYANHAIRYFDITLLSHFPHDFNCKESIKTAKKKLELIRKYSTDLGKKFENMLKCPVLYTENNGVFVFKDYDLNNDVLEFNDVLSTINNSLLRLLSQNKKIEIITKNKIKIKDEIMKDVGFMVFT